MDAGEPDVNETNISLNFGEFSFCNNKGELSLYLNLDNTYTWDLAILNLEEIV